MKNSKLMWQVLKRTGAMHLLRGYVLLFLCIAFAILFLEPGITTFRDSVWYCFSVMTTIGFGDITAVTVPGRICSIILSIYSIVTIAVIPGVLTSYYIENIKTRSNESIEKFLADLERLPELSKEELAELSKKIKSFHNQKKE